MSDDDLPTRIAAHERSGDVVGLVELGHSLLASGRHVPARTALGAATRMQGAFARAWLLLALAEEGAADGRGAAASLARAVILDPADLELLFTAGICFARLGDPALGSRLMARAVDAEFEAAERHRYPFVFPFLNGCDWDRRRRYAGRLIAHLRRRIETDAGDFLVHPSVLTFIGASGEDLKRSARYYARHSFREDRRRPSGRSTDNRPLRVGYLSNRLWDHHIGHSHVALAEAHDRRAIEPHYYTVERNDRVQAQLRTIATLRTIDYRDPDDTARRIRADGIDLLVDLDGYVNEGDPELCLAVLARRPAPVQATYHNYAGPAGAPFVDYVIGDGELFPASFEAIYDEALIRLPPCHYPAVAPRVPPVPSSRRDWGLPEDAVVFANFGNFYKIEPGVWRTWMAILNAVPGAVLWLNDWNRPDAVARLRSEARAQGIAAERLVFAPKVDIARHLGRLGLADLFLDTFAYASGLSSIYGLWAGLPLLTCAPLGPGTNFAQRFGASLNAGVGMPELTCPDEAAFGATAIALGRDRARLGAVRRRLAGQLPASSLFDMRMLARNLENAYRQAMAIHARGARPASFTVAADPR